MYFSPTFYVLVAAVFAAVQFIPREGVRLRAAVLALAGIIGIGTVLQVSAMSAVVLAVSVAALLVGSRLVAARATAASTGLLLLVAGPLLIAWLVGKVASSIGWTRLTPLLFVGTGAAAHVVVGRHRLQRRALLRLLRLLRHGDRLLAADGHRRAGELQLALCRVVDP